VRNKKKTVFSFYFLSSFQWKWRVFHNNLWLNARSKNWNWLEMIKIWFCLRDLECYEIKVKALAWYLSFIKTKIFLDDALVWLSIRKTSQDECLPRPKSHLQTSKRTLITFHFWRIQVISLLFLHFSNLNYEKSEQGKASIKYGGSPHTSCSL